jgi:hypothetical protein
MMKKRIIAVAAMVMSISGLFAAASAPPASASICVRVNITIFGTGPIGTGPVPICVL